MTLGSRIEIGEVLRSITTSFTQPRTLPVVAW
jgi:hypothetical protein